MGGEYRILGRVPTIGEMQGRRKGLRGSMKTLEVGRPSRGWTVAKWIGLAGFLATVVGLFTLPEAALRLVWFVVVPALPAVFLVNAELWRNVCPLATLNTVVGDEQGLPLGPVASRFAAVAGVVLLLAAIPMRVAVFNDSATATGVLLGAVGLFALLSGVPFQRKAGFCNSVCPILPIERLYGQSPLVRVENVRCTPCHVCTRAACYDLNPGRSGLQIMGAGASRLPWIFLPFGAFALSFPGVILGYAVASSGDGGIATIAVGGAASWLALASACAVGQVPPATALLAAAALSGTAFYWSVPPAVQAAFGWPTWATVLLRVVGLAVVGLWTVTAVGRRRARTTGRPLPSSTGVVGRRRGSPGPGEVAP